MPSTKKRFDILNGLSGTIRPGRLTLLLGPPSSGKTTLLKALSGKLRGTGLKVCVLPWLGSDTAASARAVSRVASGSRCLPVLLICILLDVHVQEFQTCSVSSQNQWMEIGVMYSSPSNMSGKLREVQVRGEVTYNGYGFDECIVGRTAAYVDQNDNHIAELTVRETLVGLPMCPA